MDPEYRKVQRKESNEIDKYLDLAKDLKNLHSMKLGGCLDPLNSLEKPGKEIGWTEEQRKNRNHPNHSTV